jgi:hypothetical protein
MIAYDKHYGSNLTSVEDVTFTLFHDLDGWYKNRQLSPGATDLAEVDRLKTWHESHMTMDEYSKSPEFVHPDGTATFLSCIFRFGHEYEPQLLQRWASDWGIRSAGKDVPVDLLQPGEYSWNDESYYLLTDEDGGKIHASLDGVARFNDESTAAIEVKTGARKTIVDMKRDDPDKYHKYVRQVWIEKTIAGLDSAFIVYGHRDHGFERLSPDENRRETVDKLSWILVTDDEARAASKIITVNGRKMLWPVEAIRDRMLEVVKNRSSIVTNG